MGPSNSQQDQPSLLRQMIHSVLGMKILRLSNHQKQWQQVLSSMRCEDGDDTQLLFSSCSLESFPVDRGFER